MKSISLVSVPLALLAVSVSVHANSYIYGTLSATLGQDASDNIATQRDETGASLDDSYSLIGFAGEEEMNTGLVVGARYELVVRADDGEVDTDDGMAHLSLTGDIGELKFGRIPTVYRAVADYRWLFDESSARRDTQLRQVPDAISWSRQYGQWQAALLGAFDGGITRQQLALAYTHERGVFRIAADRRQNRFASAGQPLDDLSEVSIGAELNVGGDILITGVATRFELDESETAALQLQQPGNDATKAYGSLMVAQYSNNGNTFALGYENANWELEDDQRFLFELARGLSERSLAWLGVSSAEDGTAFRIGLKHNW